MLMLVWDTIDPYGLTLFRSDFIDYAKFDIPVKDVIKVNRVIGIEITLHKFVDSNVQYLLLTCIFYHLYPQNYHQNHGGHSIVIVHGNQVTSQVDSS